MFVNPIRTAFTRSVPRAVQQSQHLAARTSLFRSYGFTTQALFSQQRSFGTYIKPFAQFNSTHEILTHLYEPHMQQFDTHQHEFITELTHHVNSGMVDSLELYNYLNNALRSGVEPIVPVEKEISVDIQQFLQESIVLAEDNFVVRLQEKEFVDDYTAIGKKEENLPAIYEAPETDIVAVPLEKEHTYDNFFHNAQSMFGKATNYFGKAVAILGVAVAICEILMELDELQNKVGKNQADKAKLAEAEQTLSAKETEIATLDARVVQLEKELNTWGQWLQSFIRETQTAQAHKQHQAEKIAAQQAVKDLKTKIQTLDAQIAETDKRIKEVVTERVKKGTDYVVGKAADKLTDKLPKSVKDIITDPIDGLVADIGQTQLSDAIKEKTSQIIADSLLQPALGATESILSSKDARSMVALQPHTRELLKNTLDILTPIHETVKQINDLLPYINNFLDRLGAQQE